MATIKSAIIAAAPALAGALSVAVISGGLWFGLGEQARQRDWGEFEQNEILNAGMGEEPEILKKLRMGATYTDENGEDYDWTPFFRENANEFYKLTPDSDLWGKIEQFIDLADGLQDSEIDDILNNMFEYGIFGEDFTNMMKDLYNILSREYQEGGVTELPADWWKKGQDENGVTSQDIQTLNNLPEATKAAIAGLIGSINISLDGDRIAYLLTPRVSQQIAEGIEQ